VIQLGAVLAILALYATRLWQVARAAPQDAEARRFFLAIGIAFLPSVVAGVLAHDLIKAVLFETPMLIAMMLILGGIVLLVVDRVVPETHHEDAMHFPLPLAFKVGLFQTLALIPGVSRSGATIVGAMMMGASKRAAAEFSFFLSMPTMAGAFAYDLWLNREVIDLTAMTEIATGFVMAFISAVFVVKWMLNYVQRHGYALFGWWRIAVGTAALIALLAGA
ncbi:MAG: undecaprenyl-diphosphate phosphatase, partial [Paracoccaceae bacterium]|nr:undecaprenyl-diphosphate phosphatase [Paracoccaceae bacterium]